MAHHTGNLDLFVGGKNETAFRFLRPCLWFYICCAVPLLVKKVRDRTFHDLLLRRKASRR